MLVPCQVDASTPAVVRSLEVACIHVDLGYYLGGRLRCSSLLLVGKKAGTKESKNYRFIGPATGPSSVRFRPRLRRKPRGA